MKSAYAATLRTLIPGAAVAGVLALSFWASGTASILGANLGYGYGYANNCGVKGDGFHDHGKVCPNRPFPGHGKGLATAIQNGNTGSGTTSNTSAQTTISTHGGTQTGAGASITVSSSTETSVSGSTPSNHGRGRHLGLGRQPAGD
jgi:hypothetical protein